MRRVLPFVAFFTVALSMASAQRLPEVARPENYKLTFTPDLDNAKFEGDETISLHVLKPTSEITLNAVDITFHEVSITAGGTTQTAKVTPDKDKEMIVLVVEKPPPG
jgi:aminopeptidase N